MSAYMQMGHDSQNLIGERGLEGYRGIILSPVNRTSSQLNGDVANFRDSGDYEIVLDPQLYVPRTSRENLLNQPYFPSDLDTFDLTSVSWWETLSNRIIEYGDSLSIDAIASPAVLPNSWSDDYFGVISTSADYLKQNSPDKQVLMSIVIRLGELVGQDNVMRIASIITSAEVDGYYLIFVSDTEPRLELSNSEELLGAMQLISTLKSTGRRVLVGYCSSDMCLYKSAGATHCATGKFFNLRRFTRSRFEDPPGSGGGQLPYWFEKGLLAFLRESDIERIQRSSYSELITQSQNENVWCQEILSKLQNQPGTPWLGDSWRQYLCWFSTAENQLSTPDSTRILNNLLEAIEDRWINLSDNRILFEEARNNGRWIRPWRQALTDFMNWLEPS